VTGPPVTPAALLLDLDGTLVLSEGVHRRTWQHFFDTWDVEVDDAEYRRTYLGRRAGDVLAQVRGPWTGTDLATAVRAMSGHALALGEDVEVVRGAPELVRGAAGAGVPVAVVTSAGAAWADRVLGPVLGVRDLVDVLVTAEQVGTGKPSPEGYRRACDLLRVEADRCVGVEDSPSGVRALLGAGVTAAVGVTTTSAASELLVVGAVVTVPDLLAPELLGLVLS